MTDQTKALVAEQLVIKMRSGILFWVSKETGEKIKSHLMGEVSTQRTLDGESAEVKFFKIKEAKGQTINRADIEGVYTPEQLEDLAKVKRGDWQCQFNTWHDRRAQCECEMEKRKQQKQEEQDRQNAIENKPLTPEERKNRDAAMNRVRKDLEKRGIIGKKKTELVKKMTMPTSTERKPCEKHLEYEWTEDGKQKCISCGHIEITEEKHAEGAIQMP